MSETPSGGPSDISSETRCLIESAGNTIPTIVLTSENQNNMPDFSCSYLGEASGKFPTPSPRPPVESEPVSYCKDVRDSGARSGHCGLYNLGNTCFMNSGLQSLFGNPKLVKYFLETYKYSEDNKSSLTSIFYQLLCKIWSGQYSIVHPINFKESLGLHHPQFQDFRQHDCQEFLAMLLNTFHEHFNYSSYSSDEIQNNVRDSQPQETSPTSLMRTTCVVKNKSKTNMNNAESQSHSENNISKTNSTDQLNTDCKKLDFSGPDFSAPEIEEDSKKIVAANNSACSNMLPSLSLVSDESNQSAGSVNSNDSLELFRIKSLKLLSNSNDDSNITASSNCVEPSANQPQQSLSEDNILSNVKTSLESIDIDPHNILKSKTWNSDRSPEHIKDNNLLNNALSPTRFPNLVELYSKESKTLNTNVLATEFTHEIIQTDSEKFVKQDNRRVEQDEFEDLLVENNTQEEVKVEKTPKVKDVNIQSDRRNQILKGYGQNLWSPCEDEEGCTNNIKRMKMESNEKNIQLQAWQKLNWNPVVKKEVLAASVESDNEDDGEKNIQHQAWQKLNRNPVVQKLETALVESDNEEVDIEFESDTDEEEANIASSSRSTPCEELNTVTFPKINFLQEDNLADESWHEYLKTNNSVIVNTFQGQFKSTVVCSHCSHVSITFEPFMFLAVPLPHAMERQLCVIFITEKDEPVKYLLTLQRSDTVSKAKKELRTLIDKEDADIIMAEVLDYHVSRILDDNVLLKYINDTNRNIYAFEMLPFQSTQETSTNNETITSSSSTIQTITDVPPLPMEYDVFSNVGTFAAGSVTTEMPTPSSDSDSKEIEMKDFLEMTSTWDCMVTDETHLSNVNNQSETITPSQELQSAACAPQNTSDVDGTDLWSWSKGSVDTSQGAEWCGSAGDIGANGPATDPVIDQWRTCVICLEELIDSQLVIHTACGGTLCHICLEMSLKHYGVAEQTCPVCSAPVSLVEDFVPLGSTGNVKPKTRILPIPIAFRCSTGEGEAQETKLISHPVFLYLPSNMNGGSLYDTVDKVIPVSTTYTLVLTDGQGLRCSRCSYTDHCSGCDIIRDSDVQLIPGDHITVVIPEVSSQQLVKAQQTHDHKSMEKLRPNVPITLRDCFTAFSESETLDDQNPWFCPQCSQNQHAKKTIAVWRSPDCVIVQLKRFVFHELSSTKLDNKVTFPFNDLDLSDFISGPKSTNLLYDLQSVICHYGGVHSGHYTAYTKHPLDGEWYYYNDECISKQKPTEEDYSSAYVLIYQRKDSGVSLKIPENLCTEMDPSKPVISASSMPSTSYAPQFMPMPESPEIKITQSDSDVLNSIPSEYMPQLYNGNT